MREGGGAEPEREGRAFVVEGRVQGVGFRWWSQRYASGLGLVGHVLNRPDGAVELHAVGSGEALDRLEAMLRRGPPGSRVDAVRILAAVVPLCVASFRIVR